MRLPIATSQHAEPSHPDVDRRFEQRVGALARVPALLRELGVEPEPVLASSGLDVADLRDPDSRMPYGTLGILLERSAQASGCPHFGLLAGRMWQLEDLGLVGEIARNCATVGEALQIHTVYQHLNSNGALAFVVRRAAVVDFGYAIYHPGVTGADQLYDAALSAGFNIMRELCGPAWTPTEVFLPHTKGRDLHPYRNVFKVVPRFDSELCVLRFPAYWLDRAIQGADPKRRRAALQRAQEATEPTLLHRVYRALRTLLLNGKSSGDDLAQLLSMHRRTLNRRLREQGTTFQEVLDEVRFEVARQLLSYSKLPLDDIAASLGYAGVSTFMRSFHRWTGVTPGQWRRRAEQQRATVPVRSVPGSRPAAMPLYAPQGTWIARDRMFGAKNAPPWETARRGAELRRELAVDPAARAPALTRRPTVDLPDSAD